MKNRTSFKQAKERIKVMLVESMFQYQELEHTGTSQGMKLWIRIEVLKGLCEEFNIRIPRMKVCEGVGCTTAFVVWGGTGKQKYCSDACRQAAYRRRKG